MGCDIHIVAQRRNEGGGYETITGNFTEGSAPFDWRGYGMFAFLAGVRNYSAVTPISEPRGLPDDMDRSTEEYEELSDCHSCSWLSVEELAAFDYDAMTEDRRTDLRHNTPGSGPDTCEQGSGIFQTWRAFLGEAFFRDLAELRRIGAERIVFGFDS